jgi:hypothetical protein
MRSSLQPSAPRRRRRIWRCTARSPRRSRAAPARYRGQILVECEHRATIQAFLPTWLDAVRAAEATQRALVD